MPSQNKFSLFSSSTAISTDQMSNLYEKVFTRPYCVDDEYLQWSVQTSDWLNINNNITTKLCYWTSTNIDANVSPRQRRLCVVSPLKQMEKPLAHTWSLWKFKHVVQWSPTEYFPRTDDDSIVNTQQPELCCCVVNHIPRTNYLGYTSSRRTTPIEIKN